MRSYGRSSVRPPLGIGSLVVVLFVVLFVVFGLGWLAGDRRVALAAERGGGGAGGRGGVGALALAGAGVDVAGRRGDRVLGGEAASHPGVVDVDDPVAVLGHQGVAAEEEDVVARSR